MDAACIFTARHSRALHRIRTVARIKRPFGRNISMCENKRAGRAVCKCGAPGACAHSSHNICRALRGGNGCLCAGCRRGLLRGGGTCIYLVSQHVASAVRRYHRRSGRMVFAALRTGNACGCRAGSNSADMKINKSASGAGEVSYDANHRRARPGQARLCAQSDRLRSGSYL